MPTYVVSAATGRLTKEMKQKIAHGITRSHSNATGAQSFFAQVIFQEIQQGDHFLGGSPLKSELIFIHGHIRAGRTAAQKRQLLEDISQVVVEAADTQGRSVWVYVSDLLPSQMVEYGKVLPEPGAEAQWLESMSEEDRRYLLGI
ncbi:MULTISPECIES: tautomerase family protein [Paraburkholderia]|uniref:tautomerase family protein n=1 Tax=Paraburkholderia TaxID=1822464 RepID=UPI0006D46DE9|nr:MULTISPECIES: tautomerase family protein [Paraburkholderia]CAG9221992.1 4-oxalocrotonate tautomerase [Paraburkholderia caribensis]